MTFDRLGGDLRQVLCRGGGDGGECAEGGEAASAAAAAAAHGADAVVLVAEVPVAEADVDLVVGVSASVLSTQNNERFGVGINDSKRN